MAQPQRQASTTATPRQRLALTVATGVFFIGLYLVGLAVHDDFGVGWDEDNNARYGEVTLEYALYALGLTDGEVLKRSLAEDDDAARAFWDPRKGRFARTHGPLVEVALVALERALGVHDTRDRMFLRHISIWSIFFIGVVLFYLLCRGVLRSRGLALLGCALLVLSPRIFSHAFHNSMDIPFLTAYIASIYTLVRYLRRKDLLSALAHAVACAVMIDIRIAGMMVVVMTAGLLLVELALAPRRAATLRRLALSYANHLILLCLLVVLFWPVLWHAPLDGFLAAFDVSSKDPWDWWELYLGEKVPGPQVPWHFTPVWIAVTTPPLYLALFALGLGRLAVGLRRGPLALYRSWRGVLVCGASMVAPLAAVGLLGSTLFNGWRHMYFVYPGILITALWGLDWAWARCGTLPRRPKLALRGALAVLLLASMVSTLSFMIRSHPQQLAYFNSLVGGVKGGKELFQLGYWGPEYRAGLEHLLRQIQPTGRAAVYLSAEPDTLWPLRFNLQILPQPQRGRVKLVKQPEDADYFITNHCPHVPRYAFKELWSRRVDGARVITIYKVQ